MKSARLLVSIASLALFASGAGCTTSDYADDGSADGSASGLSTPTVSADATTVTYRIPLSAAPHWVRVFLDTDRNASTGYRTYGIGAQFLVENGTLYRYSGANSAWGWTYVKKVTSVVSSTSATVTILRADLGNPAAIDLVTQTDPPIQTSAKITQDLSAGATAPTPTPAPTTPPGSSDPAPTGPVFYVSPSGNDANPGTQAAPWRTIQKAASTVNAGDTVVLMDGTYTQGSVNFDRSGTADKPIVFKAQNKWNAMIASTSGCQPGFSITASYITVKDIAFSVAGSACTTYTSANTHIRAWNTIEATPSNPTTGSAGFHADGLKLTSGRARSEGLKSNQDYTLIENCEADNALELFSNKNSIIRNNLVTGQDQAGTSIFAKGGVRNTQIYNNVVRNNHPNGNGIYLGGSSCDTCFFDSNARIEAYNSVAYNNVVVNDSGTLHGLIFSGATDSAFFNNVVIGGGVLTTEGGQGSGYRAPTTNPTLMNNILVCNGAQAHSGTYAGTFQMDSNDFFNCSGAPVQSHPVAGDPRFVNPASDWHLQAGSPALNSGTPVSMPAYGGGTIDVSRDKDGVVRTAPWDLGVYSQP